MNRGFTLIEVVVALLVAALGLGALLTTLTSSASNVSRLRDKSFAEWVAFNELATLRLDRDKPSVGTTSGEMDMGNARWRWQADVTDPGMAGVLRVDVSVAQLAADAEAVTEDMKASKDQQWLATATGFIGTNIATGNGLDPDWSFAGAAPRDGSGTPPPGQQSTQQSK